MIMDLATLRARKLDLLASQERMKEGYHILTGHLNEVEHQINTILDESNENKSLANEESKNVE